MSVCASGPFLDWESLTGLSKFWIDLISIPLFSAVSGVIVNWTGIFMLYIPVRFRGFYLPGLKTVFPFMPRRIQVLPLWAPGGIIGYQGFIPARAEKMAALTVDRAVSMIGTVADLYREFEPEAIAAHMIEVVRPQLPALVADVMQREHPQLWHNMSPGLREILVERIDEELPAIADRALDRIGENVEQLIDIRLMAVRYLTDNPELLCDICRKLAAPEMRLMVRMGLLGFPLGVVLALLVYYRPEIAYFSAIPGWVVVLVGSALIGVTVNLTAIKVVFEPSTPQPRWKYPWRLAKLAQRQDQAAADFGKMLADDVLTFDTIAAELLNGPRGDRARGFVNEIVSDEVNRVLGPLRSGVRVALGAKEFDAIMAGSSRVALDYAPSLLLEDRAFVEQQKAKIEDFAAKQLRALPAKDFIEIIYSMIEQDAWLLYAHGAVLGLTVGGIHLALFGA